MRWLDAPPRGTRCSGGFDGSDSDDHTAIRLETVDGFLFTPRYGPDRRPTIWNPLDWGGKIPRDQVHAAWDELIGFYDFTGGRVYYDPPGWKSEGEAWAKKYGDELFVEFATYRTVAMHAELTRFVTDLSTGVVKHDGCPITTVHVNNARKLARPMERYVLGKPSQSQKIDAAMTSVLAHSAAQDARASGWAEPTDTTVICFTR